MPLNTVDGDLNVLGTLSPRTFNLPAASVTDSHVQAGAGVQASKLQHQHQLACVLCDHAAAAAATRVQLGRIYGATATLLQFGVVASVAAAAGGSATIDLKKNGTTILAATISLDSATAAYAIKQPAGYTSTALVAGDVLEAEITAVAGTPPKGVTCHLVLREDAQ